MKSTKSPAVTSDGGEVSREGVQRDLLPLIEGTIVPTKHGNVKTDHILFITSGAFHVAKPSDLLPELQGRLPIRVELKPLTRDDFRRILTEPEASLIKQYIALMATEGVTLEFSEDAIDAVADMAVAVNSSVENIGARRLQTVMERVLDDVSFAAPDRSGETVKIDAGYVQKHVGGARREECRFVADSYCELETWYLPILVDGRTRRLLGSRGCLTPRRHAVASRREVRA